MARLLGPDAGSRYAYRADGSPAADATAVVYATSAATVLADIRAYDGSETPAGTILSSQVAYDGNGQSQMYWFPDPLVDRVWVSVDGGPVFPVDADNNRRLDQVRRVFNAAAFGAKGDGVTNDAAAIQAAVDAAAAAGSGEVRLGRGVHLVGATITLPINTPVALRGEGKQHGSGAMGTAIKRAFGYTGPVLQGVGTGEIGTQRVRFELSDMTIDGGGIAATVARLDMVNNSIVRNVRFTGAAARLLSGAQWWNSWLEKCEFNEGGSGSSVPATQFTTGSNTLHITDCEWEGNAGTDLLIADSIAVAVTGPKLERGFGSHPLISLVNAGGVQITGGFLHVAGSATGTHVVQSGTVIPPRPNGIANTEISGSYDNGGVETAMAAVPYFVDVTGGDLLLTNVSMNGDPTTAFVHAGAAVGANGLRMRNVSVNRPAKLLHDERTNSVYGYGSVPLVPALVDAGVGVESSVGRVLWRLPDGASNQITYGNVPIPADAAAGRPVRVRFMWYADVATGAVRYLVGVRALSLSNDDITVAQTNFIGTATVPATANRTATTTVTTTVNVDPGARWVAVLLLRVGADAADTCAGNMRVLGAELLYERAV